MTYQAPPPAYTQPPMPPSPQPTSSPWWKRTWFIALVTGVIALGIGGAAADSNKKTKAAAAPTATVTATATAVVTKTAPAPPADTVTHTLKPTVIRTVATKIRTRTVTYTPPPKPAINDGVYEVGRDIRAGEWRTQGGGDCYYAILNSTESSDIADNGDSTGQQIATLSNGKYFEISGGCDWRHV